MVSVRLPPDLVRVFAPDEYVPATLAVLATSAAAIGENPCAAWSTYAFVAASESAVGVPTFVTRPAPAESPTKVGVAVEATD